MARIPISAVVMTLNEEHNLEYCLRSVRSWCDQVIVVDMLSEDRTPEIAHRYADLVLQHERIEGFDAGREKGFESATGEWIFSIDADEVVPPPLAAWIREFVDADPAYDLALIPRANVFLGRWIRSSPWWPGKPRLFRRGAIEVTGKLHHGLVPRPGSRIARLPKDESVSLWHFAYLSMESLTQKTNRYTSIEAKQGVAEGRRDPGLVELLWAPLRALLVYVAKLGPRDGMAGLAYAVDRAYYGFMASAKRWDEARAGSRQKKYDRMREEIVSGYPGGGRPSSTGRASEAAGSVTRDPAGVA